MSNCKGSAGVNENKVTRAYGSSLYLASQGALLKMLQSNKKLDRYYFTQYPGIIGLEVEVEGWNGGANIPNPYFQSLWEITYDDSLKDNGIELRSKPMQGRVIDHALDILETTLEANKQAYFNHRCSTHVHINVTNLSMHQLINLYALYIKLEPYFLAFAEPIRRHGVFCIPVSDTLINKADFVSYAPHTDPYKYLALAFNHLRDFGTLELRLLEGTNDMVKLRRWIMMLQKLFLYVNNNDVYDICADPELGTTETKALAKAVFNTLFNKLPTPNDQDIEHSVMASQFFISE
mgnify:CR=1 FL=1